MKKIVITGANRGIGLELTRLYSANYKVYALCRASSNDLKSLRNVTVIDNVHLSDLDSIVNAIQQCPNDIDILINNAGVLQRVGLDDLGKDEVDKINYQFQINALAPLIVVKEFLHKLTEGSKIALITSRMGSIDDNSSGGHYGYRMSKAALNMAGKSLSIDLESHRIPVGIIHPGWVQTDMTNHTGHYSVNQSAVQIIDRINALDMTNTGTFWHSDGQLLNW